ncbi:hypothetical protein IW141_001967 [Coemansia sp. RSA 355]|nr:hypothetical protein IW141_001967 [Coemansia sp. RSA 355]
MISQAELESVVRDIIDVAAAADLDPTHISDDEDEQSENSFLPRSYDIDRLHADDARDKVFVAILKALAARRNKPSSPRELATCIMKHEFTLLGRVSHGQVERDELVRRTSYGDSGESASDSDANPYARKRFKSVRSAVACVYPRRSSRVVDESRAPHARRSASHGDPSALQGNDPDHATQIDSVGSSSLLRESAGPRPQRTDRGTGKWRSAYTSSEDEGSRSVWSDNTDAGPSRPESPSSAYASASEQTVEPANAMLLPPVPHTTPRASVSPDQTPFPPATSPSFHCYTDEMQAASPLLLPRSLMAIDGGLFDPGSPSLAQKDISSASLTPLVTPAIVVHSDDSVVPAHPFLLTQKPDGKYICL